jgi:phenylpropionate dioxygenase-like ring-hydroxylating dioxygenase large terminal subunit
MTSTVTLLPLNVPARYVLLLGSPVRFFCDCDIVKSSAGPKFAMYFTVTPVSERSSIAWTYVAKDYENIPDEETQQFEDMITLQDVPIVESQRPELLPLDLQAELHLRSDRTAIAYRKWLRVLELTFGTA